MIIVNESGVVIDEAIIDHTVKRKDGGLTLCCTHPGGGDFMAILTHDDVTVLKNTLSQLEV